MRGLLLAFVLLFGAFFIAAVPASLAAEPLHSPPAAGQTVSQDALKAALITADDLPGYTQITDSTLDLPAGAGVTLSGVLRGFVSPSGTGVVVELLGVPDDSLGEVTPSTIGEEELRAAATNSGQQSANFAMTGSLGVGDDDSSAVWDFCSANSGRWFTSYADVSLRGHVLATVASFGYPEVADPTALDSYARLENAHIISAGLP